MRRQTAFATGIGRWCVFRSDRMARTRMVMVMVMGLVGRNRRPFEHRALHHSLVARPAKKHCGRSHALDGHGNHHDPDKKGADKSVHECSLADSPWPVTRRANLSGKTLPSAGGWLGSLEAVFGN